MNTSTDAFQRGDAEALDQLYRTYASTVLRWVIRLGGPYISPEDVTHDVFGMAFRKCHTFRVDGTYKSWLFGVTRRVVANARRRAAFRTFIGLDTLPPLPDPGPDVSEEVETLWRRRQVHLALEQLDRPKREVLVLLDLEGHTAPEAAKMLGIAVGTVYSRLHHARKAFKAALNPDLSPTNVSVGALAGGR